MKLKRILQLTTRTLMFIDPGINCTGYCFIDTSIKKDKLNIKILGFGSIEPIYDNVNGRSYEIAESIVAKISRYQVDYVISEYPPDTIYGYGRMSKSGIVARAQSIFKLFGVCHAIHTIIASNLRTVGFFTVLPNQWQDSKKKRGGLGTKEWSLKMANVILSKHYKHYRRDQVELETKKHENIADAVTMMYMVLKKVREENFELTLR